MDRYESNTYRLAAAAMLATAARVKSPPTHSPIGACAHCDGTLYGAAPVHRYPSGRIAHIACAARRRRSLIERYGLGANA